MSFNDTNSDVNQGKKWKGVDFAPGTVGQDQYVVTWDNASGRFQLKVIAAQIPLLMTSIPGTQAGIAGTVDKMYGMNMTYTPTKTGNMLIIFDGDITNNSSNVAFTTLEFRWGTGTVPVNGAAATGTILGIRYFATNTTNTNRQTWQITRLITGATINTQIWIDWSAFNSGGETTTITHPNIIIIEF